ncbi:M20/M25/M40 family metallo-hydrolase [Schaalia sp. 19OD2882]|uniref:M20/M25/M40 family metallo-hydrolase n=1 Tax=Schaalia sp. 19OD2882 TaxID=2794089 RepID=UPI001C1EFF19|nr:M20/M25/M40 family metallo-hydrolase [Schaalia sp. 19OD2882]QWW20427.1 M20/M25/M40 family metallo-hydrolase [Schaalia sp. 19OD2882]
MTAKKPAPSTADLRTRLDAEFPALLDELGALVAIPSISSLPQHQDDLARSAEHVRSRFEAAGLEARVLSETTPEGVVGKPAILAHGPRIEGAPTVLLYAHHDVQPVGDTSTWSSDPFTAEIRGERIYGRGTSDDGAGIIVHLGALRLLGDDLPVNVVVFIEGEEEIGSPSFQTFLERHAEELSADVIVVADSDNWKVGEPAVTATLRGNCTFTVDLRVADHAVHSGMFGGPLLDAVTCGALLVASMYDEDGNLSVDGLGGTDEADVVWPEDEYRQAAGVLDGVRLAGTGDLAARVWTKPALTVIGWDSTSVADASNTLAASTRIRFSLRTVPGQDPAVSMAAVEAAMRERAPWGCRLEFSQVDLGPAYQADMDAPATHLLHEVLTEAWGVPSVNIGVGGSIPFISQFQQTFPGASVVVTGVEDPLTNAHSEDESQSVPDLRCAILAEALYLARLAEAAAGRD